MFDIGFWEILVIAVVALFVIGPEKLPSFAREAGLWFSKLRGFVNRTKREIQQELLLHEQQSFKEKIGDLDSLLENAPDRSTTSNEPGDNKPSSN